MILSDPQDEFRYLKPFLENKYYNCSLRHDTGLQLVLFAEEPLIYAPEL